MARMAVVVGHLQGLLAERLGDLGATVADVHAPQRGEAVDPLVALLVPDTQAVRPGDDGRVAQLPGGEGAQIRVRVHDVGAVERLERLVVGRMHGVGLVK